MTEPSTTRTPDFDAMYRADPDPWAVRSSFYEQRKLAILLASLARPRYARVWDPGCGTGEPAARIAGRSDHVLATDASAEAVALTRRRCAGLDQVEVAQAVLPATPGQGDFDLVVLSEFVYYLTADDRRATLATVHAACREQAEIVAVHWRPKPHDAWLSGEQVQTEISAALRAYGWVTHTHHEDVNFILDTLIRTA